MSDRQYVPEFLVYNNFGIRPTEVTFQLDCKTLVDKIREIASTKISGIENVQIQHNNKTGEVGVFIWFDANSDHFNDRSTENTAIKAKISRLSKEMQEFIEKFGWNEADDDPMNGSTKVHANKIMLGNDNPEIRGKWIAVHIAINPFLMIMFDQTGASYKKEFNRNTPKTKLHREWNWSKGSSGKFHHLNGIIIKKKLSNLSMDRNDLHAKWNGKFK